VIVQYGSCEQLPTSVRKLEEQYYVENVNTYIQITKSVICEATGVNLENNKF
jgi:hypothetical protein